MKLLLLLTGVPALFIASGTLAAQAEQNGGTLADVVVTARLREESPQNIPISLAVVDGSLLERRNTNNLAQLTASLPAVNYSSPNPRNTAYTIRGLGSSVVAVSQANDGLEPGVGFYVDGVYHARPATAAFDFVDLNRIEVLKGPQGTLFGKNTTAGAIHLLSNEPRFVSEAVAEVSLGEQGLQQAKGVLSGAIVNETVAGRLSAAITLRDGVLKRTTDNARLNDIDNMVYRGQLLLESQPNFSLRLISDYASFGGKCCTQVYVDVAPTLKAPSRQYAALANGAHYSPPSTNPYDRITDIDAPLAVRTNEGGLSATAKWVRETFSITSISAWRYWNWDAANDRDYTGLAIQTVQHIPSRQDQYSQEIRIASQHHSTIDWVAGVYAFKQRITGEPITEYGPMATYWLLGPVTNNPSTTYPANLLDGYGTDGHTNFKSSSAAVFGEMNWTPTPRLTLTVGGRYTDESKRGHFSSTIYGGLTTSNPRLIKAQMSILRPQNYDAEVSDGSASGRVAAAFRWNEHLMTFASHANGQKSGGINMSGLPLNASNLPALSTAVVKPEKNKTTEIGFKSSWLHEQLNLNADVYDTIVNDFQANVVDTGPGALRGYLSNINQVRVKGLEIDIAISIAPHLRITHSDSWTDARYESYHNGPCPIEAIGATTTVCDLTGKNLSGTPHFAMSTGLAYEINVAKNATLFANIDYAHRGAQFGDPADSRYTILPQYDLINAQIGWRGSSVEFYAWAKNATNANFLQNVTVQAGNSGLIVGTPSDPRMVGITLRMRK